MIRVVDEATAERLMPPPAEAVALARASLVALARGEVEMPPKPALHPRPNGFVNAMPAYCAGPDLAGIKVVSAYPGNRELGIAAIAAVVLLCDAETGHARGLVAASGLTAARTAAASGACIERLSPAAPGHLAITGAGVEARSHLRVAEALGVREAAVWDHRPANLERLREWAAEHVPSVAVRDAAGAAEAADGAAVVVTGIPIGADGGRIPVAAIREDALVLPIDYSTSIGEDVVAGAELLAADDVEQQQSYARQGHFAGWRVPDGPVGDWLADGAPPRPAGRVVVANLGVGAHDVLFADRVLRAAEAQDAGALVAL